jgi:hypothetical protein
MKGLLLLILLATSGLTFGQGWTPMGARSMAMANASSTLNDVWAYHHNPGALGDVKEFTAGISYENRFLLQELQSQGFAVAVPMKVGVISVGGQLYGSQQFRTFKTGLGYSMKLSDKFFAGVQLNYLGLRLPENYGSANTVTGEVGVYAKITRDWKIGASVFNLNRARLADFADDRFTTMMRLGTSYSFSKKVLVALDFEKNLDYDVRIKTGVEYEVVNNFRLRGGFATAPIELTAGMGYEWKQLQLSVGTSYHQILGWSPNFALVFKSEKSEK